MNAKKFDVISRIESSDIFVWLFTCIGLNNVLHMFKGNHSFYLAVLIS
jgi:hypothetical protein